MREQSIALPPAAPGTRRELKVVRFGAPAARPKAYLQAALHADEIPGLLVQHCLIQRLREAEAQGAVRGEIVLVPVANPIGSAQHLFGHLLGRHEQSSGINFNRGHPDLLEPVAARVAGALGPDPATNTALIRAATAAALGEPPGDEPGFLKHTLLALALDADIVLDLHCDREAILHVYTGTPLWPQAADLPAELGAEVTLLAHTSGGNPFDEACSTLWWRLAERFPAHPIANACLAATVELRGAREVDEAMAERDAAALYRFLQRRGLLAGDPGPLPAATGEAVPLEGVAEVTAPHTGVVSYLAAPGARVRAGQPVAVVIDPMAAGTAGARSEVAAPVDGILYARRDDRLTRPGQTLCRIAGREPLPERIGKHLLSD